LQEKATAKNRADIMMIFVHKFSGKPGRVLFLAKPHEGRRIGFRKRKCVIGQTSKSTLRMAVKYRKGAVKSQG
jgi:hypothetical protein